MRKKIIIAATAALLCASQAEAFKINLKKTPKPRIDYSEWISEKELPGQAEDGLPLFYPKTEGDDSVAVIKGTLAVDGLTAEQAMLAAMVYAADRFDAEKQEGFQSCDYANKTFTITLATTQGSNNKETTYTRNITFAAKNGKLDFSTTDIKVKYRLKGILPKTSELESLHPESDNRHEELVIELVDINSAYLNDLAKYASSRTDISATHYAEIKKGKVALGMNMDEVTLAKGPARDTRRSGERTRWIYDNNTVIVFTDGKVSKVID